MFSKIIILLQEAIRKLDILIEAGVGGDVTPSVTAYKREIKTITVDTNIVTTSVSPINNVSVYVNGLLQNPGTDYSIDEATGTITFVDNLVAGDIVTIYYLT